MTVLIWAAVLTAFTSANASSSASTMSVLTSDSCSFLLSSQPEKSNYIYIYIHTVYTVYYMTI